MILEQHAAYVATLQSLGLVVVELAALPQHPDAYFVEDTAVITPEIAVLANMGAPARQGEEQVMAPVEAQYHKVAHIASPGTVDGGDVLVIDQHCMIGISERTNKSGASQLINDHLLMPAGFSKTEAGSVRLADHRVRDQ